MMEQVLGQNVNFVVAFYKNVYIYTVYQYKYYYVY